MNNEIKVGDQYVTEFGYFCMVLTVVHISKEFAICDAEMLRDGSKGERPIHLSELLTFDAFTGETKEKVTFLSQLIADADVNDRQAIAIYNAGYRKVNKDE